MSNRFAGVALAVALVALGLPGLIQAQGLTGQISGTVTDTTGGVLPGVTVAIKNVGTGLTRDTVTGTDGTFVFPDLLAGTFDLTVTMQGFKTYEQKGIELGVDRSPPAASDRARRRRRVGDGHGPVRGGAGADDQRRTLRADHPREYRGHRPQGPRLRRHAEAAARGHRHPQS